MCDSTLTRNTVEYFNEMKHSLASLVEIARGLVCDGYLSDPEIHFLNDWLEANDKVANEWPGDVIYAKVKNVLEDGIITESERSHLMDTLHQLISGTFENLAARTRITEISFDEVPRIEFARARFYLMGDFLFAPRDTCHAAIAVRGGIIEHTITKRLRYLVVGNLGTPGWTHSGAYAKFERAMRYKRDGCPISIIKEDCWARFLKS